MHLYSIFILRVAKGTFMTNMPCSSGLYAKGTVLSHALRARCTDLHFKKVCISIFESWPIMDEITSIITQKMRTSRWRGWWPQWKWAEEEDYVGSAEVMMWEWMGRRIRVVATHYEAESFSWYSLERAKQACTPESFHSLWIIPDSSVVMNPSSTEPASTKSCRASSWKYIANHSLPYDVIKDALFDVSVSLLFLLSKYFSIWYQ